MMPPPPTYGEIVYNRLVKHDRDGTAYLIDLQDGSEPMAVVSKSRFALLLCDPSDPSLEVLVNLAQVTKLRILVGQ
jgi:hypothetical protein